MSLKSINSGSWCLFCCNQKLCNDKGSICYPKSFASHKKLLYVIDKIINLNKVFKYSSSNRLTFMCNDCNLPFNFTLRFKYAICLHFFYFFWVSFFYFFHIGFCFLFNNITIFFIIFFIAFWICI